MLAQTQCAFVQHNAFISRKMIHDLLSFDSHPLEDVEVPSDIRRFLTQSHHSRAVEIYGKRSAHPQAWQVIHELAIIENPILRVIFRLFMVNV